MSEKIIKAVEEYFEFFNSQDAQGIAQLYADNAKVTDPVGTPTKVGKEAILSFYKLAVKKGGLEKIANSKTVLCIIDVIHTSSVLTSLARFIFC